MGRSASSDTATREGTNDPYNENIGQVMTFENVKKPPVPAGTDESTSIRRQKSFIAEGTFGNSFKLLKACNFCRKRKIKCTLGSNGNICDSCKEHGRECVFDHKVIKKGETRIKKKPIVEKESLKAEFASSHKNYPKTMMIRSQINETISNNVRNLSSYTGTFLDHIDGGLMEEYNKSVGNLLEPYPNTPTNYGHINVSPPSSYSVTPKNSLKDLYVKYIEPYTPFLSDELFDTEMTNFATCCINVSSVSSPFSKLPESAVDSFMSMIHQELPHVKWSVMNLSCFFLLPSRIKISKDIVDKALYAFNELYASSTLPVKLITGALCVDAWNSLFNEVPLITDSSISKKSCEIFDTMDIKDFKYQFINVTVFLYKSMWLRNNQLSYEEKRDELIRFEYNMLLFPANLSKNLMVVRDTLLSTPEAFILHILHNVLMIAYYTFAVSEATIGEMTSIMPFPGLYHFISGMAISNFRVTEKIVGRWSIIADSQVYTANMLVKLYHVMEFETFTFTLQFYTRRPNNNYSEQECIKIDEEVKDIIKDAVRDRDDDFDGAVVFWVFRDVRSMSLQLYINDMKRRGSFDSDMTN